MAKKKKKKTSKKNNVEPAKSPEIKPPEVVPYPTAGPKITEFEEKLDAALAGDTEEKRGRGRPRKEVEPGPIELDIKVVAQAVQVPFDLWALTQRCEHLKISDQEAILIGKPLKVLIDYYLPQIPEIAWAWIGFTAATYGVVKSRLIIITEIKKQKAGAPIGNPSSQGPARPLSSKFPTIEQIQNPY